MVVVVGEATFECPPRQQLGLISLYLVVARAVRYPSPSGARHIGDGVSTVVVRRVGKE